MEPNLAKIEFDEAYVESDMAQRTLFQFRSSALFQEVLAAFAKELQELQDAIRGVQESRTILGATGEQLDMIGRIVGQRRVLADFADVPWFTPDSSFLLDSSPIWTIGAVTTADVAEQDGQYRKLILAKIFRNFARYCSIPEIQQCIRVAFGIEAAFTLVGPMELAITLPKNTPANLLRFFTSTFSNEFADDISWLPIAQTCRIVTVGTVLPKVKPFAMDVDDYSGSDAGIVQP